MTEVLYPVGYGTEMVTMAELRRRHEPHMHPEQARRLFPWLESCKGLIGIGGGVRADGSQPDKPGFAPEGQSFHQRQQFADHPNTYAAVDLVVAVGPGVKHRSPRWQEVPAPKSAEAVLRGVHCNVYPSEPWHAQPLEISGWKSWVLRGRPGLRANYPIPHTAVRAFAPAPTQRKRTKLLQWLNSKAEVVALQNICIWWGFHDDHNRPPLTDGQYGTLTEQCVTAMQEAIGATPDGVYGPQSQTRLQWFLDSMAALAAGKAA